MKILGSPLPVWRAISVAEGIVDTLKSPSVAVPIPVVCIISSIWCVIPVARTFNLAAPLPAPIFAWSKNNAPALYPEPPATIVALVTWPPATITLAVAPFHVPVWELFKILTFWYVPLV